MGADAGAVVGEQVGGEGAVPEGDVGGGAGLVDDGPHDLEAGGVAQGVDDAAVAVAALHADRLVEAGAVGDQVVDLPGRLADDELGDAAVAQAGAGGEGVLDVVLEAVLGGADGGDAPLGPGAVAELDLVLGDDQDAQAGRRRQGGPQPGDAAADDQQVGEQVRRVLRVEAEQVAVRKRHGSVPAV